MAIYLANTSKATSGASSPTSISWSHTSTGSDLVLVVYVATRHSSPATVTYNGVSVPYVGTSGADPNNDRVYAYALANPNTGSNTVLVSTTGNAYFRCTAATYAGCDTTSPVDVSGGATGTSGTTPTTALTVVNNGGIISDCLTISGTTVPAPSSGQTVLQTMNEATAVCSTVSSTEDSIYSGSNTVSYANPSANWALFAVAIKAGATKRFVIKTVGSGSWTVPSDWYDGDNTIECIGGGSAGRYSTSSQSASGGGGGAYSRKNNLTLTPGTSVSYYVGAGATVRNANGEDTWFVSSGTVMAKGSYASSGSSTTPGAGGLASSSVGDVKYNGGSGGAYAIVTNGGGGGGAGGPDGAGQAGYAANDGTYPGKGGQGGNGSGGLGGDLDTIGGAGTEWNSTHGSGGGGGGGSSSTYGAKGGAYGAGGGGSRNYSALNRGGHGEQGVIIITYTPVSTETGEFKGDSNIQIDKRQVIIIT